MPVPQKIVPHKGVDLDSSEQYIEDAKAVFLKNISYDAGHNTRVAMEEGSNAYNFTPLESNTKYCNLTLPVGNNYCIGFFYSKELKQAFVFVYNSNKDHFIYMLSGGTGTCQMVIKSSCLNFQLVPEHFIAEGRCVVKTACFKDPATGEDAERSFLIYTDNYNDQRFICIEDIIATSFFDPTLFPYFQINDDCNKCDYLNLGVPTPLDCIQITPIARNFSDPEEMAKMNLLLGNTWEFRVKHEDVWYRPSEHGNIATMYIPAIGSSCVANSVGQPRCLRLKIKAGCALVNKIHIECRNWLGNTRGYSTESDWKRVAIIDLYDCEKVNWWLRDRNPNIIYNTIDNTIEYDFCANGENVPIDVTETNRVENPLARLSGSLFPIGKGIALARNKRNFFPMDCTELAKIEYSAEAPTTSACVQQLRKVTIYMAIWSWFDGKAVPIRKKDDHIVFGSADCTKNNPFAYDQVLPSNQEGIIGYFAGTKIYAISKQVRYDTTNGEIVETGLNYPGDGAGGLSNLFRYVPLQKFEFHVPDGNYVFRLASHKSSPQDDYQKTSTYSVGLTSISSIGDVVDSSKEIRIAACGTDIEFLSTPFMMYDLTRAGKSCGDATSVNAGYIYEDEIQKIPYDWALVDASLAIISSGFTDWNGFYWTATRKRGLKTDLTGYKGDCSLTRLATSRQSYDSVDAWYRFDVLYAYHGSDAYPSKDRVLIKGKVLTCTPVSSPLPGALVILTHGGTAVSNGTGDYTIITHRKGDGGGRDESIVFSQFGACLLADCADACSYCFADESFSEPSCDGTDVVVSISDRTFQVKGSNKKGPKMGGRYGIATILHDWMGRVSFAQTNLKQFVDIPTLETTQTFDFSRIRFDINGAVFPPTTRKITFAITDNLNYEDWLTWVAERVQYIDGSGNTNSAAPTYVRFYYESLGEYNKLNNLSTNTNWEFIDAANKIVEGDYIELLANGDGTIFTQRITARITHDKEGKYFQVDYDSDLANLKDGCLVQFIRPKTFQNDEFYYELCPVIKVVNGQAAVQTGYLEYFDSYLQTRQLPVPVAVNKPNSAGVIETTYENHLTSYPFFFEHHSPSDLWGDHAHPKGRVFVKNPQEAEMCWNMEIANSKVLDNNGLTNLLGYFEEIDIKRFEEGEKKGITTCIPDGNTILVICEYDNFVVIFNDPGIESTADGRVVAPGAENKYGKPLRKVGNDFGCQLAEINTIRKRNGVVMFLDASRVALVQHNYNQAEDVSVNGFKSWLASKINDVLNNNTSLLNPRRFFHGVIDPKKDQYLLTDNLIELTGGNATYSCPTGYVLTNNSTVCTKVENIAPISTSTPVNAAASRNGAYSEYGSRVFAVGFSPDGTGSSTTINTSVNFWKNYDGTVTHGPMNRNGVWVDNNGDGVVDPLSFGAQLPVSIVINSATTKRYYFGIGGDNQAKLIINGVDVVNRTGSDPDTFKWWNIYPATLNMGANIITIVGTGDGSISDAIAMEIYENTEAEILASTDYTGLNVRFKTADVRGGALQVITCPSGYQPLNISGAWVCQRVLNTAPTLVTPPLVIPSSKFINDYRELRIDKNETMAWDILYKAFRGFVSFTPEYYGAMESDLFGPLLLSFRIGEAWYHHQLRSTSAVFNQFYGVAVDKVIEVVFNLDNTKVKNFLWNEVYIRLGQLFADRIISESGQTSRLMPMWWEKRDKFWTADFKCATNTISDAMIVDDTTTNALLDGDLLYGRWLKVRYVGLQADRTKYFELTAIIGFVNGAEKSSTK